MTIRLCELLLVIKVDKTFSMGFLFRVFNPILSEKKHWRRVSFSIFALLRCVEVRIF